ncbi:unnamed protein product [Closterium sp. NIES-54]
MAARVWKRVPSCSTHCCPPSQRAGGDSLSSEPWENQEGGGGWEELGRGAEGKEAMREGRGDTGKGGGKEGRGERWKRGERVEGREGRGERGRRLEREEGSEGRGERGKRGEREEGSEGRRERGKGGDWTSWEMAGGKARNGKVRGSSGKTEGERRESRRGNEGKQGAK